MIQPWIHGLTLPSRRTSAAAAETFDTWRAECPLARHIERRAPFLGTTVRRPKWETHVSLRWSLLHMLEEAPNATALLTCCANASTGTTGE